VVQSYYLRRFTGEPDESGQALTVLRGAGSGCGLEQCPARRAIVVDWIATFKSYVGGNSSDEVLEPVE
jgi:hypothetical protein